MKDVFFSSTTYWYAILAYYYFRRNIDDSQLFENLSKLQVLNDVRCFSSSLKCHPTWKCLTHRFNRCLDTFSNLEKEENVISFNHFESRIKTKINHRQRRIPIVACDCVCVCLCAVQHSSSSSSSRRRWKNVVFLSFNNEWLVEKNLEINVRQLHVNPSSKFFG